MKKTIVFILATVLSPLVWANSTASTSKKDSLDAKGLRVIKQTAWKPGEKLSYEASYGIIDAARVTLEVTKENKKIAKRNTYHFVGKGKSLGAFNWFFEVNDHYDSFTDRSALVPWIFTRRVHEGGFKMNRTVYFNQFKKKAKVDTTVYKTVPNSQDLMSMFYYLRSLDLQNSKVGQIYTVNTFFDMENTPLKVKFLGRETCKTSLGKFNCLKFRPVVEEGRVFKDEETMTIWITDDQCKVPIRVKTDLLIGSLKMDLTSYEGLTGKLNQVKKKKRR